jgi:hypothetical protein
MRLIHSFLSYMLGRVRIMALALLAVFVTCGCKSATSGATLQEASGDAASCDLGAIERAIDASGVIAALQSDATSCLDSGTDTDASEDLAGSGSTDSNTETAATEGGGTGTDSLTAADATSLDQTETSGTDVGVGFALAGDSHRLSLRLVVGWRVMNDLLQAVASQAVHGSSAATGTGDVQRLREQVRSFLGEVRPVLKDLNVTAQGSVLYSYSDLYHLVKTQFVDPQVYGYGGPFHRIIHRRYARGRGIVYRIVSQKLAEGLADFDAKARGELAALSDGIVGLQLQRVDGSLSTAEASFLTLFHNESIVGRSVAYSEARQLAETARVELPKLLKSPAGVAATALATDLLAKRCTCKVENGVCSLFKEGRMLYYLPGTPSCTVGGVDQCPRLKAAAGSACQ